MSFKIIFFFFKICSGLEISPFHPSQNKTLVWMVTRYQHQGPCIHHRRGRAPDKSRRDECCKLLKQRNETDYPEMKDPQLLSKSTFAERQDPHCSTFKPENKAFLTGSKKNVYDMTAVTIQQIVLLQLQLNYSYSLICYND